MEIECVSLLCKGNPFWKLAFGHLARLLLVCIMCSFVIGKRHLMSNIGKMAQRMMLR